MSDIKNQFIMFYKSIKKRVPNVTLDEAKTAFLDLKKKSMSENLSSELDCIKDLSLTCKEPIINK